MPRIELDLSTDLTTDANGQLSIAVSAKEGNTLIINQDGIYAPALPGADGSDGTGYADGAVEGVLTGFATPYSDKGTASHRMTLSNTIHRVFTALDDAGSELVGFRNDIDYVLAGDMYRVKDPDGDSYTYYLVTVVSNDGPGNEVGGSVRLGSW